MGDEQTKLGPSGRSEDFGFYSLKWEPSQGLKQGSGMKWRYFQRVLWPQSRDQDCQGRGRGGRAQVGRSVWKYLEPSCRGEMMLSWTRWEGRGVADPPRQSPKRDRKDHDLSWTPTPAF